MLNPRQNRTLQPHPDPSDKPYTHLNAHLKPLTLAPQTKLDHRDGTKKPRSPKLLLVKSVHPLGLIDRPGTPKAYTLRP